jgi:hypothetical protein
VTFQRISSCGGALRSNEPEPPFWLDPAEASQLNLGVRINPLPTPGFEPQPCLETGSHLRADNGAQEAMGAGGRGSRALLLSRKSNYEFTA